MNIRIATTNDAETLAAIHQQEIGQGFLSTLPKAFLANLYRAVIASPDSFCVVAEDQGHVVGFISGTTNIKGLYRYFMRHYFFSSCFMVASRTFSISFIKRSFENLLYPSKESGLPPAELLTMAVTRAMQGKGVAKNMFKEFVATMKERGVPAFRVLVGEQLKPAIAFYEKQGFTFVKDTALHGKDASRIYMYAL